MSLGQQERGILYWEVNSKLKTIFLRLGQGCQTEIVGKRLLIILVLKRK